MCTRSSRHTPPFDREKDEIDEMNTAELSEDEQVRAVRSGSSAKPDFDATADCDETVGVEMANLSPMHGQAR